MKATNPTCSSRGVLGSALALAVYTVGWASFCCSRFAAAEDVTYTIGADEALAGPKAANPNIVFTPGAESGKPAEASIAVHADKVVGHVNPMVFGTCFEDLNHEIYGGLYAQMIFGESFEEGPEKALPPGWVIAPASMRSPTWEGMWCSENDAIGMTGFRWYKMLWQEVPFGDGKIDCEMMQPDFDLNRPVGLVFRAGGKEFDDGYAVMLDAVHHRLELRAGKRSLAGADLAGPSVRPGQWVRVAVEATGGTIRVFAGDDGAGRKPLIQFTDPKPLPPGPVGFDAGETHAWFRKLNVETGGKRYTPPLTPTHPAGYRGPVSQWWDPVVTGGADAAFGWDADKPFNTLRSQKIQLRSGAGTAGVANRGLGRLGLSVLQGHTYAGRLYLRGDYAGQVTVALQNADGSKTYASQKLSGVGADWKKFPFSLESSATDHNARFAVWIDQPGAVWVDQVVLTPTGDGLFKGLPVRADLAQLVVDSGVTCIRLGGDYSGSPGFKWKTMLGDPDRRPQYDSCWYPFETRGWSIVEFIAFCRAAGIEPIPCINHEETPQDVADLIEFCNGSETSTWGARRAAMGYAKPFALKYVQLGNGCPPMERLAAVADAMHAVDPGTRLLSGSIGHVDSVLPGEKALQEMRRKVEGKVYAFAAFPYNSEVTGPSMWQRMIDRLQPLIPPSAWPTVTTRSWQRMIEPLPPAIRLYAQEVNGGNHNLLRGLTDAAFDNVTERNGDFVDIVTYCGMLEADRMPDNGWEQGRIFYDNHHCWLQPHGWTIRMAREHYQPLAVEATEQSPHMTFKTPIHYGVDEVDVLSVGAARSDDRNALALKVVNFAPFPVRAKIHIDGSGKWNPQASMVRLTGPSLKLENTADQPDLIKPAASKIDGVGEDFVQVFPGYSYSIIDLAAAAGR